MQSIALNELWTLVVALLTIGLGTAVMTAPGSVHDSYCAASTR